MYIRVGEKFKMPCKTDFNGFIYTFCSIIKFTDLCACRNCLSFHFLHMMLLLDIGLLLNLRYWVVSSDWIYYFKVQFCLYLSNWNFHCSKTLLRMMKANPANLKKLSFFVMLSLIFLLYCHHIQSGSLAYLYYYFVFLIIFHSLGHKPWNTRGDDICNASRNRVSKVYTTNKTW